MIAAPTGEKGSSFAAGGAALVEFARPLTAASSLQELERAFAPRFGRLMTVPMYGFYALDREGSRIEQNVAVNVSDFFVARYVRAMDDDDMLLATPSIAAVDRGVEHAPGPASERRSEHEHRLLVSGRIPTAHSKGIPE